MGTSPDSRPQPPRRLPSASAHGARGCGDPQAERP